MKRWEVLGVVLLVSAIIGGILWGFNHMEKTPPSQPAKPPAKVAVATAKPATNRVVGCQSETERALNKMGLTMRNSVGVSVVQSGNK